MFDAEYEIKIDSNLYKTSEKKKLNHHDSDEFCPTSIKDTIKWFTFLTIMKHTANIMKKNKGLILSLLNTCSSPRRPLRSHSLICSEKYLFIAGIERIRDKEIEFIFRSHRSDCTCILC